MKEGAAMKLSRESLMRVLEDAWNARTHVPTFAAQADAVLAKLAELEATESSNMCAICGTNHALYCVTCQTRQVAQAELTAYVAACKALCGRCNGRYGHHGVEAEQWSTLMDHGNNGGGGPCNIIRRLIADWRKAHDPKPKCGHNNESRLIPGSEVDGTNLFRCVDCGMVRRRGWLGDWEKPDATV
jgi:hypothetical protein